MEVWSSRARLHSLLHSQEAQQRLIGLFVQTQDSLPVLSVRLLLLQPIQSEERRVESREEQREQQRGAAHHHSAATQRKEQQGEGLLAMRKDKVTENLCMNTHTHTHLKSSRLELLRTLDGDSGGSGMMAPSSGIPGNKNLQQRFLT